MPQLEKKWLTALIVLCLSLGACGKGDPVLVPVPIPLVPCVEPATPDRVQVDPDRSFDDLQNAQALMEQDDPMREYIKGLRDTIDCYRAQLSGEGRE